MTLMIEIAGGIILAVFVLFALGASVPMAGVIIGGIAREAAMEPDSPPSPSMLLALRIYGWTMKGLCAIALSAIGIYCAWVAIKLLRT
jgi:hypothetical protein